VKPETSVDWLSAAKVRALDLALVAALDIDLDRLMA